MKKIPVNELKAGMSFSAPVYIEGDSLLVPAGVEIRKKDLEHLNSWGINAVETEGDVVQPKAGTDPKGKAAPAPEAPKKKPSVISLTEVQENRGAYRSYVDLIERLDAVFASIGSGVSVEPRSIDDITGRLLQAVREQRNSFIGYILGGEVAGREMAKSSVNTAILSALIAMELKLPNHKIMQVVTGALLHDVGMLRLPKEIVDKKGGLSASELQRIQAHPLYTYKIVNKELLYPEDVGLIVLQHHERWDGDGYPRRISSIAIDIGARIVSVADAFEAMVSQKPYRNSMMGYQAMKNLLSDNSRRFDPDVLKAFIQTMGIYPIGSIILLNSGALARVVEVQGTAPLRPKIRILIDEFGKVFKQDEGNLIDLLAEKSLFIARAVDPREVAKKHA
ncbi:HD-GYP domain-containing protein [Leadbettera azotonutricia]|uniref:HD domain protein n=1 Tax=Leadbettera azotonutricia (strain ATCC BAA-888 / DSM 13862 / ZAS-9) TaxID=545695 RepID=F5YFP8_LEAAZ|nr:HD-GYP domain-containing protein [Leadbettera azotonutricia]AEF83214.1 HD domain protein [Leadbettera azotonutricia ZAS-9]